MPKADVEFLMYELTGLCPFRPSSFLQSGRTAKSRLFELECSEADIGDLTLPSINGPTTIRN
jgi:hypothetical protein